MQQILFIELLGGIGDVLIGLAAIQALARTHAEATVTVLTFEPGGALLLTDPLIGHVIYAEKGKAKQAIEHLLHEQHFDLIVSDTNYDAIADIISASHAERVVTNLWRSPPANQFVGDRFIEILLTEGLILKSVIAPPRLRLTLEERQLARRKLGGVHAPIVVLCPDAGMQIKRWAEANFIELGRTLQQQFGASIVIPVGSDLDQAESVADNIGGNVQVWEPGTLREFAAMLSQSHLVIAADTGAARISAALDVPTITLFGPSWHGRYGQPKPHINLQGYSTCSERKIENFTLQSCWYSGECPISDWATCVDEISVDRVIAAAVQFLQAHVIC